MATAKSATDLRRLRKALEYAGHVERRLIPNIEFVMKAGKGINNLSD
jgi:hypothetical protein